MTKATSLPDAALNLKLKAPIDAWEEAVPLGNGMQGGLLWGGANRLRLSLDRGDLWDLRTAPETHEPGFTFANMQRLVKEQNEAEITRLFDAPYGGYPAPTKIPGGRLEIDEFVQAACEVVGLFLATIVRSIPGTRNSPSLLPDPLFLRRGITVGRSAHAAARCLDRR